MRGRRCWCCAKAAGERLAQDCHSIPAAPFGAENAAIRGRGSCARPPNCRVAYSAQLFSTAGGVESSPVGPFAATARVRGTDRQTSGAILMPARSVNPPITRFSREHFASMQSIYARRALSTICVTTPATSPSAGYLDSARIALSSPPSVNPNIRPPSTCRIIDTDCRYSHSLSGSGLSQAKRGN
jgi:hypothetical protein